jgi:hypothetical protein
MHLKDISLNLQLLCKIVNEPANRRDRNTYLLDALECCTDKIEVRPLVPIYFFWRVVLPNSSKKLHSIVRELEPIFSSSKLCIRLWTKFKAAHKKQKARSVPRCPSRGEDYPLARSATSVVSPDRGTMLNLTCRTNIDYSGMLPVYVGELKVRDQNARRTLKDVRRTIQKLHRRFGLYLNPAFPNSASIRTHRSSQLRRLHPAYVEIDTRQLPSDNPASALQAAIESAFGQQLKVISRAVLSTER